MDALSRQVELFCAATHAPCVWVLPLDRVTAAAMPWLCALLDDRERRRVDAFRFEKDALAYAAAHALLRWAFSLRHGRVPAAWDFTTDPLGKPLLCEAEIDTRFSLTHTDGLVAVALAEAFDIGVDAEAMNAKHSTPEMAESVFTEAERAQLRRPHDELATEVERFFALWTLKEALLKAKGLGLNQHPATISLDLGSKRAAVPPALAPVHAWRLEWHKPTGKHMLSVAVDCPADMPQVTLRTIDDVAAWHSHCMGLAGGA